MTNYNKGSMIQKIFYPFFLFIFSRIAIFALAGVFISLFPLKTHPSFLTAFSQWDGQWYLQILKDGYWYKGPMIQSPVAFFPLYPFLGKILTYLGFSSEISLFLVSNLSCLGFFYFFWRLTKEELGEETANKALFYYAISPLSFIFSSLYTESLFLFLVSLFFYFLKRKQFLKASLVAGLASATRPFGIFLTLSLFFVSVKDKNKFWKTLAFCLVSSFGLITYSIYLYLKLGEIMPFLKINNSAWHHIWVFPWESFRIFWNFIIKTPTPNYFFSIAVFDFLILILFTFLLFYSLKKIPIFYQLFTLPTYFLALCQPWDPKFFLPSGSLSRYMFQLLPLMMFLGFVGKRDKKIDFLITFFFASLLGPFSLAFFHGFWVE